jgi:hypothetical protein
LPQVNPSTELKQQKASASKEASLAQERHSLLQIDTSTSPASVGMNERQDSFSECIKIIGLFVKVGRLHGAGLNKTSGPRGESFEQRDQATRSRL